MHHGIEATGHIYCVKASGLRSEAMELCKTAYELGMSASEINAGVKRGLKAGLLVLGDMNEQPHPNRKAMEEFLVHGIKYAFPADHGPPGLETTSLLVQMEPHSGGDDQAPGRGLRRCLPQRTDQQAHDRGRPGTVGSGQGGE